LAFSLFVILRKITTMIIRFLVICFILVLIEFYAFQAIKTIIKTKWILQTYQLVSFAFFLYLAYSFLQFDRSVGQTQHTLTVMGLLLLIYLPKIVLTLVLFGEDIFRGISVLFNLFVSKNSDAQLATSRRKFVSQIGLGLAAIPFLSLIYGMTVGKYNYKVIKQQLYFPDLPDAFDGFTITQISDVHSGSFDNPEKSVML